MTSARRHMPKHAMREVPSTIHGGARTGGSSWTSAFLPRGKIGPVPGCVRLGEALKKCVRDTLSLTRACPFPAWKSTAGETRT
jgi:hypothetical protein